MIPRRIRATKGQGLIVILGNTKGTIERNILEPMRNIYGASLVRNISSDNTVQLFGKKAYALGADKKNRVEVIQGAGIEYCYGDEITTWSEEVFQMLKSRLDKPNSVFDGTCNPDNPGHWFKKFLDSDADIFHQHYTIDDNPFLDPYFVEQLKKEYAGTIYYDRFIEGRWVRAEGVIYDMFSKEKHVVETIDRPYSQYYISIDYGTQNPTVFGLWGLYNGIWYKVKEYHYSGREEGKQKTDAQYADDLGKFVGLLPIRAIIVDPSAASFIAELKRRKWYVLQADNNVLNGIRNVATALNQGQIKYNDCCEQTFEEFESYSWDKRAAENGEDRPIKEDDHHMDSDRYFVNTVIFSNRGTVNTINRVKYGI